MSPLEPLPVTNRWVPHTPDFLGAEWFRQLHAPFLKERRTRSHIQCSLQEIRGISLVFGEVWDTTNANRLFFDSYGHER
jgi:hypothetical protein